MYYALCVQRRQSLSFYSYPLGPLSLPPSQVVHSSREHLVFSTSVEIPARNFLWGCVRSQNRVTASIRAEIVYACISHNIPWVRRAIRNSTRCTRDSPDGESTQAQVESPCHELMRCIRDVDNALGRSMPVESGYSSFSTGDYRSANQLKSASLLTDLSYRRRLNRG